MDLHSLLTGILAAKWCGRKLTEIHLTLTGYQLQIIMRLSFPFFVEVPVQVRRAVIIYTCLALLSVLGVLACRKGMFLLPPRDRPKPTSPPVSGPFAPVSEVFGSSCAIAHCHDQEAWAGQLVLSSGQSYGNLVNVKSSQKPGEKLVSPGEPQHSYLLAKIRGEKGIKGSRMPIGRPSLSLEQEKVIEEWIAVGAKE